MYFSVFKRGDRWYLRKRVPGGRDTKVSLGPEITTEAEAKAVLKRVRKEVDKGRVLPMDQSTVTLGQLRAEFLAEKRGLIAETSLKRYAVALKALAEDLGDGFLLRGITPRRLSQWASDRLARQVTKGLSRRQRSRAGVNADLRHIKAVLRTAEEWGYLEKAPKIKKIKEPTRLGRDIAPRDLQRILMRELNPDRRRLWEFMAWTGCRRTEALGLRWETITWEPRPLARVIGKGDKERTVLLFPPAVAALGERQKAGLVFLFMVRKRGQAEAKAQTVHRDTITHWWEALAQAAGLRGCRLHDLRHTFTTRLLEAGVSYQFVQKILGHESVTTTEGYSHGLLRGQLVANLYDDLWGAILGTPPDHS